ncbi:MAG: glycosyltransferase family 2 protein [Geitlerinemataceae cyanobacterium]
MTIQFSIIIPTFNDLERLKRSISSAGCQTLPCEVVVIDDGSRDGTEQYVRSLGKQVVYYRHPVPIGYAESANAGVELARGNWIVLLDDRQCLPNNYLERLYQAIDRYPKAAIAVSQTQHPNKHLPEADRVVCIPQEDIHDRMLSDRRSGYQTALCAFRRDAFLRSGGWHSRSCHAGEVIDAWVRIAQCGDAVFFNSPLSDRSDVELPAGTPSVSQSSWEDLEIQSPTIAQVDTKHRHWLTNSPTVQMIQKFHWNWMGLKNSCFPGIDGVLPGISLEVGTPGGIEQDTRRSNQRSFSKVFHRTVSPGPISQLSGSR